MHVVYNASVRTRLQVSEERHPVLFGTSDRTFKIISLRAVLKLLWGARFPQFFQSGLRCRRLLSGGNERPGDTESGDPCAPDTFSGG